MKPAGEFVSMSSRLAISWGGHSGSDLSQIWGQGCAAAVDSVAPLAAQAVDQLHRLLDLLLSRKAAGRSQREQHQCQNCCRK